ncbi:conserved hypothetical protein [Streptomyces sp. SPB78]|nr:conserved hypothetical protein [Streptomyces sp. SPB78]
MGRAARRSRGASAGESGSDDGEGAWPGAGQPVPVTARFRADDEAGPSRRVGAVQAALVRNIMGATLFPSANPPQSPAVAVVCAKRSSGGSGEGVPGIP